jgi:hypothetical protein
MQVDYHNTQENFSDDDYIKNFFLSGSLKLNVIYFGNIYYRKEK